MSRYGKLPEIHHIFKEDAKNPPIVITLAFLALTLVTLPILGVTVSTAYKKGVSIGDRLDTHFFSVLVALPRRQSQSSPYRAQIRPCSPRRLPWLVGLDRRSFLPVLYFVEPFPTAPCCCRGWCRRISQW